MRRSTVSAPEIFIACVANVFTRQMHFKKAGDVELGQKSECGTGSLQCRTAAAIDPRQQSWG